MKKILQPIFFVWMKLSTPLAELVRRLKNQWLCRRWWYHPLFDLIQRSHQLKKSRIWKMWIWMSCMEPSVHMKSEHKMKIQYLRKQSSQYQKGEKDIKHLILLLMNWMQKKWESWKYDLENKKVSYHSNFLIVVE